MVFMGDFRTSGEARTIDPYPVPEIWPAIFWMPTVGSWCSWVTFGQGGEGAHDRSVSGAGDMARHLLDADGAGHGVHG